MWGKQPSPKVVLGLTGLGDRPGARLEETSSGFGVLNMAREMHDSVKRKELAVGIGMSGPIARSTP